LSTGARTVVRLVDELNWLNAILQKSHPITQHNDVARASCAVKSAAALVLEQGAALLDSPEQSPQALRSALALLRVGLDTLEAKATVELPVGQTDDSVDEFITSLDPSFRAQELSFAVSVVARNIDLTAAAERRSWIERLLGRQPAGLAGALSAAQERAGAHVERHSVWLHNSVRGAIGLGLAVLIANLTGVQHSFWVVLGTLSVLRSNALNTGQNAVRGLLGTVVGFVIGALLLAVIGTDSTVLWVLLPFSILLAGVAPSVISFAAGQAAFTLTLVILFNIIQPVGWRVGLLRVEDIALGCAVSLVVGILFWPRGASAALNKALAEAYIDSAGYLADAVEFGMLRCDATVSATALAPIDAAVRAAAASRRLDDTFRNYLAESGAKPVPLAEMTSLVTGVAALRLAADAVLDLWQRDDGRSGGDRSAARTSLLVASSQVNSWYNDLAASLGSAHPVPDPLVHDRPADSRLVEAVRHDLRGDDGQASATGVRMIWTADHVDAARRLQTTLVGPAHVAAASEQGHPWRRWSGFRAVGSAQPVEG
jgi:uncharacterized membrane protein YccC